MDLDVSGEFEYEKSYKKDFIVYYDLYYAPINNQARHMSIPQSGLNTESKHIYSSRRRAVIMREALANLKTDSDIEPPEPDCEVMDPACEACPAGIVLETNILEC